MGKVRNQDLFQLALLALIVMSLITNAILFQRLNRFQTEVALAFQNLETNAPVEQADRGLVKGVPAPIFEVRGADGQIISSDQFAKTKTLMVFTATDCPSCDRVYPMIKKINRMRSDWQVLLIVEGQEEEVLAIATDKDVSFPVAFWDRDLANQYLVEGTPFYTAIDDQGMVMNSGFVMDQRYLEAMLEVPGS